MTITVPSWSPTAFAVIRIGLSFAVVLYFSKVQFFRPAGRPSHPVGVARLLNLEVLSTRVVVQWTRYLAFIAALCYAAGQWTTAALFVLTVVTIGEVTFRSSFGAVNHGTHLLAVVFLAQMSAVALWNMSERFSWSLGSVLSASQESTVAWWAIAATIAVYFTSGLTKLINSNGLWIARSPGLLLSVLVRIDTDRQMGTRSWGATGGSEQLVTTLVRRPTLARWLFALGLLVELASPIGLLHENLLLITGIAFIGLHLANGRVLGLPFPVWQLVVVSLLVLPAFF